MPQTETVPPLSVNGTPAPVPDTCLAFLCREHPAYTAAVWRQRLRWAAVPPDAPASEWVDGLARVCSIAGYRPRSGGQ